jgi:hypothetical protein
VLLARAVSAGEDAAIGGMPGMKPMPGSAAAAGASSAGMAMGPTPLPAPLPKGAHSTNASRSSSR